MLLPILEGVDDPDVCEVHEIFLTWFDDGDIESGPGEPYLDCAACRDWVDHPTINCYLCVPHYLRGDQHRDKWPERRTVRMTTVNPADPTTAYHLECGHTVI